MSNSNSSEPVWWKIKLPQGWRFGVLCSTIAAFLVFLINLVTSIWTIRKYPVNQGAIQINPYEIQIDPYAGLGIIYEGSCEMTKSLSFWIHGAINLLSTVLLSASNYTIQCLVSPNRKDLDRAHKAGRWLDIGVPSLRNYLRLSTFQNILWIILWLTSLPLHLL